MVVKIPQYLRITRFLSTIQLYIKLLLFNSFLHEKCPAFDGGAGFNRGET